MTKSERLAAREDFQFMPRLGWGPEAMEREPLTKMRNDPFRAHSYAAAHRSADDHIPEKPEPVSTLDSGRACRTLA
jgi:hypothetical protein